ncbi:hypothetical protein GCM10010116_17060 [Microbispora rosea subsp. aerata]|nr:hypothetical protein GCM10010116_17060 [Microbispora rosea subsp. aerata]GIH55410.1 hypothetical protein Mro02_23240 [Microbispora rosea subsp. aerata]GLJ84607.1 hypothetical protein GCM10017588_33350 [Microbispora rosea subsp. aerata]
MELPRALVRHAARRRWWGGRVQPPGAGAFVVPAAVPRDPVSNYKPLRSFVPGYFRIQAGQWPLN